MNRTEIRRRVQLFVELELAHPGAELDAKAERLQREGIDATFAEALFAFVPVACAHAVLEPRGVIFQDGFEIWDPDSGERVHGLLADDPIYVATRELIRASLSSGDGRWVQAIADGSAEVDVVRQLSGDGPAQGLTLTEPVFARLPTTYLPPSS